MNKENSEKPIIVRALYGFNGKNNDELNFKKGALITVTQIEDGGWWEGTYEGITGWFPSNYVKEVKEGKNTTIINADDTQKNRSLVLTHLINVETDFLEQLNELINTFISTINASSLLDKDDQSTLLSNLPDLLQLQEEMLTEITEIKDLAPSQQRIGQKLMERAPQLKSLYEDYSKSHAGIVSILNKHNQTIFELFQTLPKDIRTKLQLTSPEITVDYLKKAFSTPFRHLEKYPLILKELENHLELSHPDRGDTQRALIVYKGN